MTPSLDRMGLSEKERATGARYYRRTDGFPHLGKNHHDEPRWGLAHSSPGDLLEAKKRCPPRVRPSITTGAGPSGAPRVAALFYSLMESAKLAEVEPRAYLGEARPARHLEPGHGDAAPRSQVAVQYTQLPRLLQGTAIG